MSATKPPPIRIPRAFTGNSETAGYFNELHTFLRLLWDRTKETPGIGDSDGVTLAASIIPQLAQLANVIEEIDNSNAEALIDVRKETAPLFSLFARIEALRDDIDSSSAEALVDALNLKVAPLFSLPAAIEALRQNIDNSDAAALVEELRTEVAPLFSLSASLEALRQSIDSTSFDAVAEGLRIEFAPLQALQGRLESVRDSIDALGIEVALLGSLRAEVQSVHQSLTDAISDAVDGLRVEMSPFQALQAQIQAVRQGADSDVSTVLDTLSALLIELELTLMPVRANAAKIESVRESTKENAAVSEQLQTDLDAAILDTVLNHPTSAQIMALQQKVDDIEVISWL